MESRIKEWRTKKGYRQDWVAEKVGVTQQRLSNWENNHGKPRYDLAYKLAKVLGVSMEELYKEE